MADVLTKEKRSWNMAQIKSINTTPELSVRKALHSLGYRFRLHQKNLPGKPDIVLSKYKAIIFVHGCFWHRHPECKYAYTPKSREGFWKRKFQSNVNRFRIVKEQLEGLGWKVLVLWECEIKVPKNDLHDKIDRILKNILLDMK